MNESQRQEIEALAYDEAMRLVADGVDETTALEWAVDLATKKVLRSKGLSSRLEAGVGDLTTDAEKFAKEGQAVVSPYLWIASVVGFLMAIVNSKRIATMYGSWKAGRKGLRLGKLPED